MSFDSQNVEGKTIDDKDSLSTVRELIEEKGLREMVLTVWPQPTRAQGDNIYNCY